MPRILNAEYVRRIMKKDKLTGLEVVFLTEGQFGIATRNESLLGESGWIDADAPRRYARDRLNFRGWTCTGTLYCAKCWMPMKGVPRDIVARNWCDNCSSHLYDAQDEKRLDFLGFTIYRDRVMRYMQIAVRKLPELIDGSEHLSTNGGCQPGYHKDHVYSVRDAFEHDVEEHVVSSPPNVRVIRGRQNMSKGRKSERTLEELYCVYRSLIELRPQWIEWVRESDSRQETFVVDD